MNQYGVDLKKVYRKIFWIGFISNVLIPAYYIRIAFLMEIGENPMSLEEMPHLKIMLFIFIGVSICCIWVSKFIRRQRFFSPMIKSSETFKKDFSRKSIISSVVVNAFPHAVVLYGLIFSNLSGQIEYLYYFMIPSVILFFFIRPNYSYLEKSLAAQENFVSEGKYYTGKFGPFKF